ncbi:flagellar motor protein MotB [Geomonas limicola]|uniref:Flagellar motor protein MotB n=1 Tax=Geomonas limicola TaxID=2740186 RepID=A0A6V8N260_9BACT|nr:DUF748 domain-containing protein [Geomonas limicola]GFO66450.1 flagellar motor protein MotB [Geomonas limicola]
MRLSRKHLIVTILSLVILATALFLGFPPLARHLAVQKISEATGRRTEIGRISLNPFTMTAAVVGFRLCEKGSSATFVSFSSARLSLSPLSLPKRAFIVREITLDSPYVHLVRSAPNRFNFSDLITEKKQEPNKKESYLFSLNNITLKRGQVLFQDDALKAPRIHRLRELTVTLPFISNVPYLADRYVTPHFSAFVNDTPVVLDGRLKPLSRAMETVVDLKVRALDLPYYLGYVPFPLPVRFDSGQLTSNLEASYRIDAKTGPEVLLSGSLSLDGIDLKETQGAPLSSLKHAGIAVTRAALLTKQFDLARLDLERLEVFASRDANGKWNFQKLSGAETEKPSEPPADKKPQEKNQPLLFRLAQLSLKDGSVHFQDALPKGGFRSDLSGIEFSASNFSTERDRQAPFDLTFATSHGEKLALKGQLSAEPLDVKAHLALIGIPLKDYYPYLADTLTTPVSGKLGLEADLAYNATKGFTLEKSSLKGENLAASFGNGEGILLKETLVSGIALDLNGRKAGVESVEFKGGNLSIGREADGSISAERLLKKETGTKPAPPPRAARKETTGAAAPKNAPFSYRVGKVSGSELGIRFTDRSKDEAPTFTLAKTRFSVASITGPRQGTIPFTLSTWYGKGGRLAAAGDLTPAPFKVKGKLELGGIPLRDFDAYIPEGTQIFLADGALDARLSYDLAQDKVAGLTGNFAGNLGVHSFYCLDTILDEDLLKWDSLQLDQVKGTLAPFSLAIQDVSLSNFYAKVTVERDGSLNLQHLSAEESKPATPTAQAPGAPPAKPASQARAASAPPQSPATPAQGSAPAAGPRPIRIDTVAVQGGTLDFSDRHLKTPFATTFYNLGGRVSGLSSETNRTADVDLRGNLENHSPLSITGKINPLRGDLFLDLKIAFTDIELSPFTPYSNTFLGYMIDKGKLNLDLAYKIDKKALTSSNKLFIDQFTFGKAVESDKATKLPVRLAVALLKDRKGEIHLDLPVVGQTDDPKFSVWGVVLQMLKNLLVKAATSPFALLGSLFGGGEDFSAIPFDPGSAHIGKPDEAKLLKLAKLLDERPALNLEISGFVDRERDAEGYRNELLVKKMKGEKFRAQVKEGKTRPGQTQDDTEILPQEYSTYLKAVYAKEKFPKPRNVLGIAKDLPDAEMRKLILTHTVVGENELQQLARERAEAVRNYLLKAGKLPPQRLFEKNADIYRASTKEGGTASRVEFGAMVK